MSGCHANIFFLEQLLAEYLVKIAPFCIWIRKYNFTIQENNLKEVNTNYVALRKNHLELTEYKCMLKQAETFLSDTRLNFKEPDEHTSKSFLLVPAILCSMDDQIQMYKLRIK